MNNPRLQAALDYAGRGFSIIPIKPDIDPVEKKAKKNPYIRWTDFKTRRPSEQEIRQWWTRWPNAMIGIVTGEISGLLVVDCDNEAAYQEVQKLFPEGFLLPVVKTPRGWHLWFLYPKGSGLTIGAGILPGVDYRAEGGYIIGPPSVNGEGKGYEWLDGLSLDEVEPPPLPDAVFNILNNSLYREPYKSAHQAGLTAPYSTLKILTEGRRDNDLFHAANCLIKGGCEVPFAEQVLNILARNANPPFPENEIKTKIDSALKRGERREGSLRQEFLEWATLQEGYWNLTEACKTLKVLTKEEKNHLYVIAHRLKAEGIIEKHGNKSGEYRTIQADLEPVNFLTAPTDEFPINWPMEIEGLCSLYPGNIIIVAGSKSAGKTAFLLNVVRMNQHRHGIVYLNSEMGDVEFRKRLELFEGVSLSSWKLQAYHRTGNFADLITPDRKIFIVDFLEVTTDFWKVGGMIQEIHKKLREGVCIIALQKAEGKDAGRGGDFSKEKARLYLSLDYLADQKVNRIKITDAKAWRTDRNPRGMFRNYKLVKGSRFVPTTDWRE